RRALPPPSALSAARGAVSQRTGSHATVRTPTGDPLPPVTLTPQLMYRLLASEIAAQRGQVSSAAATYLTLARETRDPRIARRATELALAERSLERALPAAQLWHEL